MPTYNANILPAQPGLNLGSDSQPWNLHAQNVTATGSLTPPSNWNVDSLTTGEINGARVIDGVKFLTIQQGLDDPGSVIVIVPDSYIGEEETSVLNGQQIWDYRATHFGVRGNSTNGVGVFNIQKSNESDSTYLFFLRPHTEDGNTQVFFARSPIGGTNPIQAIATIQAHGNYTSEQGTLFTDKNLIIYTADASGSLIDRFRIEALQDHPRVIIGSDLSATSTVIDQVLVKTVNGILLRKRTGDTQSDNQTVIVPSAGAFGFRKNDDTGDISAIYKDTADIMYLGNTGTPSVLLAPAATPIMRATSSGIRIGDSSAPTAMVDVLGKLKVDSNGIVTKYDNIATDRQGIPILIKSFNGTGLNTAAGTTTLYTTTASGHYQLHYYLVVSTAGNAVNLTGTFGWNDGVTVKSVTTANIACNILGASSTLIGQPGVISFDAASGSNITYATALSAGIGVGFYKLTLALQFISA